jgi:hypothetical protein
MRVEAIWITGTVANRGRLVGGGFLLPSQAANGALLSELAGGGDDCPGMAPGTPAPADYDGDGRADAAVFRDGIWYLRQPTGGFEAIRFGLAADRPVPGTFVR